MQWLIVPEITMALVVLTAIPVLNIFQGALFSRAAAAHFCCQRAMQPDAPGLPRRRGRGSG
jgi:hypothetical protein